MFITDWVYFLSTRFVEGSDPEEIMKLLQDDHYTKVCLVINLYTCSNLIALLSLLIFAVSTLNRM